MIARRRDPVEPATGSGGRIGRAMHSGSLEDGSLEGTVQAYGIVISWAGARQPLRRILQVEREPLLEAQPA